MVKRNLVNRSSVVFNLTVAGIKVLEGLSASGLRSVRYALEVPGIEKIVANDISDSAFKLISENIKHNGLEALVIPSREDAR